ncbi:MAG: MATE family efflux transporter [Alphaproteobacteria bacterium]|nr:MAG: MATE family efflux transporter [Alphaproteobacteria bacterium]
MQTADGIGGRPRFLNHLMWHWGELLRLAWPVMLSRAGILVLTITDVIMVGRYDTTELSHIAMGYAVMVPVMVTGVGAMMGIIAVTAQHSGAGRSDKAAETFRHGLGWAVLIGTICAVLIALAEPFLRLIGHVPELAAGGGLIARWLAPGAFLQILFVAAAFYLEATKRMLPPLLFMAVANLVNIALNWLLIGGEAGFPGLGAEGAAIASVIARAVMLGAILIYIARLPEIRRLPSSGLWGPGGWAAGSRMRRIGLAAGVGMFFETMAFGTLNQIAGFISPEGLAAYTIGHQVEATIFMVALGLSVATAVRVGHAFGAGDRAGARFAGWSGLAATMLIIAVLSSVVILNADRLGGVFSADPAMIARTAPLFVILAISLIFDGGQVVMGQSTRALGDSWGTTACYFAGFWGVMIPLGAWLGLHSDWREAGLFIATAAGCLATVSLLSLRFAWLLRGGRLQPA